MGMSWLRLRLGSIKLRVRVRVKVRVSVRVSVSVRVRINIRILHVRYQQPHIRIIPVVQIATYRQVGTAETTADCRQVSLALTVRQLKASQINQLETGNRIRDAGISETTHSISTDVPQPVTDKQSTPFVKAFAHLCNLFHRARQKLLPDSRQ